jgi:hypothetical protein
VASVSIVFGLLLVALGIGGYVGPEVKSGTALIPTWFGLALVLLGLVALKENLRKHAMHLAAMVGLLGVIGGVFSLLLPVFKGAPSDPIAAGCKAGMTVLCAVFVGLCVNSFIQARRRRAAAP